MTLPAPPKVPAPPTVPAPSTERALSLYHLLAPAALADPYPLYKRLQTEDPIHWDPYLHAWVVTRYDDVAEVLLRFRAQRIAAPARMAEMGMGRLAPLAELMVRQMLFVDPPDHSRLRRLSAAALTPSRMEHLRGRVQAIAGGLLDRLDDRDEVELMEGFANPFPAIVTAEVLGVPAGDHPMLRRWTGAFAEVLGNFQSNADRSAGALQSVMEMIDYFQDAVTRERRVPTDGLIHAMTAAGDAARLSSDEVLANLIITMVGGLETTTNLIGNGILTLLRHPDALDRMRSQPEIVPSAIEELMRIDSPIQHTARVAPAEAWIGGQKIPEGQAVIAVMAAANRDPARFSDPERLDLLRTENRHLAFGWGPHFCVGAPLARLEGRIAFESILRRWNHMELDSRAPLSWRPNLGLRGLTALPLLVAS